MLKLKIPPPIYFALFATMMWLASQYFPLYSVIPENKRWIGYLIIAVFLIFDIWSILLFFIKKTTINPMKPKNTETLVVAGLYRISRNPMYVGLAFILFGWAIHLGALSAFLLLPFFVIVITFMQILPEEQILEQKFGDSYLTYKKRVRRWI